MFMPRHLTQSVDKIARQALGKDWGLYAALLEHWAEIVGADYARVTTPAKIAFPHQPNEARRKNGTLTIRLPKGLAMEFTYKTEQIRQRINSYFGYDAVGKIAFAPESILPTKRAKPRAADAATVDRIKNDVKTVENSELRDVLQAFGEAISASHNNVKNPDQAVKCEQQKG